MNFQNPILIKELRQQVRGKTLLGIFVGALVIGLFAAWAVLQEETSGDDLCWSQFMILCVALCLPVSVQLIMKFKRELWGDYRDLMYVTTLTPAQIVVGKFLSVLAVAGILLSAAFPALMLSVLLGGVGALEVAHAVAILLMLVSVVYMASILIAAIDLGVEWIRWILVAGFVVPLTMISFALGYEVSDLLPSTAAEWIIILTLWVTILIALYVSAIAALTPETENRMKMPRIVYSVLFVLFMLIAYAVKETEGTSIFIIFVVLLSVFHVCCERTFLSRRALAQTKKSFVGRVVMFPFSSGFASGIVWCLLNIALITLINLAFGQDIKITAYDIDFLMTLALCVAGLSVFFTAVWHALAHGIPTLNPRNQTAFMIGSVIIALLLLMFGDTHEDFELWSDMTKAIRNESLCDLALSFMGIVAIVLSPYILIAFRRFKCPAAALTTEEPQP